MGGLVRGIRDDGQVEVDFGGFKWHSEIGELEPVDKPTRGHLKGSLQVGNLVRVPRHVRTPSHGWGKVSHKSIGFVSSKGADGLYVVNFPEVDGWKGAEAD